MTATTAINAVLVVPSKKPRARPIQSIPVPLSEQLSLEPASVVGTIVVGVVVGTVVEATVVISGTVVAATVVIVATVVKAVVPTVWQVTKGTKKHIVISTTCMVLDHSTSKFENNYYLINNIAEK